MSASLHQIFLALQTLERQGASLEQLLTLAEKLTQGTNLEFYTPGVNRTSGAIIGSRSTIMLFQANYPGQAMVEFHRD